LAGHPYLGPNILFQTLHEDPESIMVKQAEARNILRSADIRVKSAIRTLLKLIILFNKCNRCGVYKGVL
jgi:hypothetical protein